MSWIAVDAELPNHAKMALLPNDAARWGWIVTLCEAKVQRKPGTFASERHFCHVLARHGRFLPDYIKAGLIDQGDDGSLAVHDWQKHQWAAAKAAQRETPAGHSEDIARTFDGQKQDASRAVSVPVLVGTSTEGGPGGTDEAAVFAFIAQHGAFIRPDSGYGIRLLGLIERRGATTVLAKATALAASGPHSDRQWTFGLERALEDVPDPRQTEAKAEADKAARRRDEAIWKRRIEAYQAGGKWDPAWGDPPVAA